MSLSNPVHIGAVGAIEITRVFVGNKWYSAAEPQLAGPGDAIWLQRNVDGTIQLRIAKVRALTLREMLSIRWQHWRAWRRRDTEEQKAMRAAGMTCEVPVLLGSGTERAKANDRLSVE